MQKYEKEARREERAAESSKVRAHARKLLLLLTVGTYSADTSGYLQYLQC
jgi:hypothetical protein